MPRLKTTNPVPSYKGQLTLGNPDKYETALTIDVERYPRTMIRKPPTASSYVVATENTQSTRTIQASDEVDEGSGNMALVRNSRVYQVIDEDAPGGKREVPLEDLAKGYEYGRTAVPISESDMSVTRLDSKAGLEIMGFIQMDKVGRLKVL